MVSKQEKVKKQWDSLSIEVPLEGTTATIEGITLTVKGEKGELTRDFKCPNVQLKVESDNVIISTDRFSQREKKMMFTFKAHIKNMVLGVTSGFEYNLVVVFAKFPMTVELKGNIFYVKNLLGEKVPRSFEVSSDVKVVIKGKDITVTGIDKEKTGQAAASIEQLCKISHLDRRVVQDGIYITTKPHRSYQ
ncbi:MAG: 50S ribosomal protein L6 [Candidatus Woesearchaeota archaeon]|jgi:large subunit ribosomal protein L6|nr:50S ribosomal protein L6 [Candidatus Woesearchaeota archaeon]